MNIQQLEYIIAVDRFKNFAKAADHCYVTQATLRGMIKKLEVELDIILFDRTPKAAYPTNAGLEIIEEAKIIVQQSQQLAEKAKRLKHNIAGTIKVGILPSMAAALLPRITLPLLESYPDLELEVSELTADHIIKQLGTGHLDLGILSNPADIKGMEKLILFQESLMVYGDVDASREHIRPEEIRDRKFWFFEEGLCLPDQLAPFCSVDDEFNATRLYASAFKEFLDAVIESGMLTLIPELYYQTLTEELRLHARSFIAPEPVREMSIIFQRSHTKTRVIKALADLIRNNVNGTLRANRVGTEEEEELNAMTY